MLSVLPFVLGFQLVLEAILSEIGDSLCKVISVPPPDGKLNEKDSPTASGAEGVLLFSNRRVPARAVTT
jgi:hypothetical protein